MELFVPESALGPLEAALAPSRGKLRLATLVRLAWHLRQRDTRRSADAFRAVREVLRRDGVLGGLSSGAVLHAALKWAQRVENANIVLLFADSGWKYLSAGIWTDDVDDVEDALDHGIFW